MRRALALLPLVVPPLLSAAAQSAGQPAVSLIIYGGVAGGQHLWQIDQPLCVWQTVPGGYQCESGASGPVNDTLHLTRRLGSGISAGVGLAKYFGPHVGVRMDLWIANESIEDRCSAASFQPDSEQKNLQSCNQFSADNQSLSFVGVAGSALLRAFPGRSFSPYLRFGLGVVIPAGETLAASGTFSANGRTLPRQMVVDSAGVGARPYAVLGAGMESGTGNTLFRLELTDAIVSIDRVTGPADISGQAPRGRSTTHNFTLTAGIAMVLSSRRGRRY